MRHAIDRGVNYVDTAWPYHMEQSEPFLGRALADGYRGMVKLATKLPSWMVKSRGDMDFFLNELHIVNRMNSVLLNETLLVICLDRVVLSE